MQQILDRLRIPPGARPDLAARDPRETHALSKADAKSRTADNAQTMATLQRRLHAERSRALLVVLQGMDASGKDSVIRHALGALNPQGFRVVPFAKPSARERAHGFLWRIHARVPAHGEVVVFNRSHYEDVLVPRVEGGLAGDELSRRFDHINAFERTLADSGTRVVKIFLHISREKQGERLMKCVHDPEKNWKFDESDFEKRRLWDDYMQAYEAAIERCSTEHAPWHVVPADRKWWRTWAVSEILRRTLEEMDPKLPKLRFSQEELERLAEV